MQTKTFLKIWLLSVNFKKFTLVNLIIRVDNRSRVFGQKVKVIGHQQTTVNNTKWSNCKLTKYFFWRK